jgi:hypothetical protein
MVMWTPATRRQYSREALRHETDLTDGEWALIEPLMPKPLARGRPWQWPLRELMNAIFYVRRGGAAGKDRIVTRDLTRNVRDLRGASLKDIHLRLSPLIAGGWLTPESPGPENRVWTVSRAVKHQFEERCRLEQALPQVCVPGRGVGRIDEGGARSAVCLHRVLRFGLTLLRQSSGRSLSRFRFPPSFPRPAPAEGGQRQDHQRLKRLKGRN